MNKIDRVCHAINEADSYMLQHHNHMLDASECVAVIRVLEALIELAPKWLSPWKAGNPPKRGAYAVRSDGPSSNPGWRYWFGPEQGWGNLSSSRAWCLERSSHVPRKTPVRYPILWCDFSVVRLLESLKA